MIGSHGSNQITRQKPEHMTKAGSHGKNQVTRDKLGSKCDLQAPHGGPGYGVTLHLRKDLNPTDPDEPNLDFEDQQKLYLKEMMKDSNTEGFKINKKMSCSEDMLWLGRTCHLCY